MLTISLSALSEEESGRLVASLIERAVIPVRVRAAVLDRAQGNPLYAEEFARLLAEGGMLDDVPESVQGIIAARLDGLARDEKELLQDAAVVGKVFWSGALAQMRGRERQEIEAALHSLERKEFVRRERRSSVAAETEFAFRHILVRDVAYGQIPRGARAERHAKAAEWIESLGRPADHAELLAHHYISAIELAQLAGRSTDTYSARARTALRDAGDRALSLNAFAPAARYFRAALDLMAVDDPDRPSVLFRYGKALRVSAEAGGEVLAEAETALRAAGDLETASEAAVLRAELAWFGGDGERTSEHLARAAELVDGLSPSFSKAFVLSDLSRYHMLAGRSQQAIAVGREALAIAEQLGLDEVRAHALNNIGTARVNLGDAEGVSDAEAALEIALAINSPEAPRVMNNLASSLTNIGETKRAHQLWREQVLELVGRLRERGLGVVLSNLGIHAYYEGRWDQASGAFDQFISEAEAAGGHPQEGIVRAYRGRMRFARGDVEGALHDAESGVVAGRRSRDPQSLIPPLSFMAWLMLRTGREREANELLDELVQAVMRSPEENSAETQLALFTLGRQTDMLRLVDATAPTRWREILALIAADNLQAAADLYDELDMLADATLVRMHAAKRHIAAGRNDAAREQLSRALVFWRSVGATHFIQEADALAEELETATPESTLDSAKTPSR